MNSAYLQWTPSADTLGIEGYQIWRSANGGPLTQIATTDGGISHYAAGTLYASTNYHFNVIAIDTAGQTSTPAGVDLTTLSNSNTTPPSPPADASVAAHAFSDTRIDVVWAGSPSPDVSGYQVFRSGTQVGRIDLPGGLRYSDNGLTPNTSYTYTIKAIDSAGNISAPTTPKLPATTSTLATGTVQLQRGPYLSNVTATSAIVSWWTNIPTSGAVHYGTSSPNLSATDSAGTVQHHQVTLTGLTGGATYQYTVNNGGTALASSTFHTAAPKGTAFSFAAIGDFGGASPGEGQNAANMAVAGTSFVQTLGDNIYPSAGLPDPNFNTTLSDYDARFFKQFGPVVQKQAFFPANGNQEYYSNGEFWNTFPMLGSNHSWYSYNWGDAHILVLDTELNFATGSPQYTFAQNDLAANQGAAWRIVIMQRPPYSSTSTNSSSTGADQYLVPLFDAQHVNLVLSGNSHNYERSFMLKGGNKVSSGGTVYVVSGGGGNGHNAFTIAQPSWSAARNATNYEFTKVSVSSTSLTVAAIDAATNTVLDSTTMSRQSQLTTAAYIALTRQGTALYVNGQVNVFNGSTWAVSPNRTVYVQRIYNGAWQTILQRTTNSSGHFTVGFVQPAKLTYRLYVPPTSTATGAYSANATG